MGDALGKMFAIILVIILLAIYPIFQTFSTVDKTAQNQVNVITDTFQKEVRNRGFMDKELFDDFNNKLMATGRIYDIKLQHRKLVTYVLDKKHPDYNEKVPFMQDYMVFKEDAILKTIYNKKQVYKMKCGDEFTVLVEEAESSTKGTRLFFGYFIKDPKSLPKIFAKFSGVVENKLD